MKNDIIKRKMGLFWKNKMETVTNETESKSVQNAVPIKEYLGELIESSNGMGLVDFKDLTPEHITKIKEFAKGIGVTYRIDRKNELIAAMSGTKFENLIEEVTNMSTFYEIYFDNMDQLHDFANFIDTIKIANYTKESRILAYMLDGKRQTKGEVNPPF